MISEIEVPAEKVVLPTTGLVIACGDSDHGWDGFFPEIQEFLLKKPYELRMGQYFPLLRDGGATALAYQNELAVDFFSLKGSMLRICKIRPLITDVFIFIHFPCGYYQDAVPKKNGEMRPEKNDGPNIVRQAERILRGKRIWGFFKPNSRHKTDFMPIP